MLSTTISSCFCMRRKSCCGLQCTHSAYHHARHRSLLTCFSGEIYVGPAEPVLSLQHATFFIICFAGLLQQHKAQLITYKVKMSCCGGRFQYYFIVLLRCSCSGGISTSEWSFQQPPISWHHLLACDGLCVPGVCMHCAEAASHSL